ncbi:MAG: hypothetical protein VX498_07350 [Myxococcota bacterium]|nr:hypothetical protein [Myxococcota bacterium]
MDQPARKNEGSGSTTTILGGMFGLAEPSAATGSPAAFLGPGALRLANARSGMKLLVEALRPERVWLPSFLCESLIEPIASAGLDLCFYSVDSSLQVQVDPGLDALRSGDLLVQIHYFGFPVDRRLAALARERGAHVVDDAAQALLSSQVGSDSDFVLTSPRKFVGVPDGATLTGPGCDQLTFPPLGDPPTAWAAAALAASTERAAFDAGSGDRAWFEQFQEVEKTQPTGAFAMSALGSRLLDTSFDWGEIARKRRANYRQILSRLSDCALFPELPDSVVPLGFPVRLAERDRVRADLMAAQIYPPVHWPVPDRVPSKFAVSRQLAAEIMTLPCDQRYGADDMDRVVSVLQRSLRNTG